MNVLSNFKQNIFSLRYFNNGLFKGGEELEILIHLSLEPYCLTSEVRKPCQAPLWWAKTTQEKESVGGEGGGLWEWVVPEHSGGVVAVLFFVIFVGV